MFPCPRSRLRIWSRETGQPSRPTAAWSFSTVRLNLALTRGIPPAFRGGVHLLLPPTAIGSVPSFIRSHNCVPMAPTNQESAGTGPVVLKVIPVTGAAFSGTTMDYDQLICASLFPHPLYYYWYIPWWTHVIQRYRRLPYWWIVSYNEHNPPTPPVSNAQQFLGTCCRYRQYRKLE